MTPQWDDLQTALVLARTGTLAAAAQELGINYTTVARRIKRLEEKLDLTLFERLPEGYRATEAALRMAGHIGTMEDAQHLMMRDLLGRDAPLAGTLTVTAPQLLIAHVLGPVIETFRARHPDISLVFKATNDTLDLTRREADIALRISRSPGDTLKGLRLVEQETASFGTPDWAARIEADRGTQIDWIVYEGTPQVPRQADPAYPNQRVGVCADDMMAMLGLAQAGLGVVRMPLFLGQRSGLVQLPLLAPQPYMPIWVVAHPDVWPAKRVTAFRDCLVPFFRQSRELFLA